MENAKKTKMTYFLELRAMVENMNDIENQDELLEFIDKDVETLERRKDKARERAEKKRAESDAMTDTIFDTLHYDYLTIDDVLEQIDNAEYTKSKVISRLGRLVRAGKVEKEYIKTEDGKRKMGYRKTMEEVA